MPTRTRFALSGLVLTVLVGCGDNPVDPPDTLAEAEALALLESIMEGSGIIPDPPTEPGPWDVTVNCLLGGQTRTVGTYVEDPARIEMEAVVTPTGCKVSGDGLTYTLDGDPSISIEMTVDIIELFEKFLMTGSWDGKVKWQEWDRSGDCAINLSFDVMVDLSDPGDPKSTGSFKGKMCGHDVELGIPTTLGSLWL